MHEKLSKCERPVTAACVVIALIATVAGPRLNLGMTRDRLAATDVHRTSQITALQTALQEARRHGRLLEAQVAGTELALQNAQAEVAALKAERDDLVAQVATATNRMSELEGRLAALGVEADNLKELRSLHELTQQRDNAVARAERAEDRIRELTLQLHRSGIWP